MGIATETESGTAIVIAAGVGTEIVVAIERGDVLDHGIGGVGTKILGCGAGAVTATVTGERGGIEGTRNEAEAEAVVIMIEAGDHEGKGALVGRD